MISGDQVKRLRSNRTPMKKSWPLVWSRAESALQFSSRHRDRQHRLSTVWLALLISSLRRLPGPLKPMALIKPRQVLLLLNISPLALIPFFLKRKSFYFLEGIWSLLTGTMTNFKFMIPRFFVMESRSLTKGFFVSSHRSTQEGPNFRHISSIFSDSLLASSSFLLPTQAAPCPYWQASRAQPATCQLSLMACPMALHGLSLEQAEWNDDAPCML